MFNKQKRNSNKQPKRLTTQSQSTKTPTGETKATKATKATEAPDVIAARNIQTLANGIQALAYHTNGWDSGMEVVRKPCPLVRPPLIKLYAQAKAEIKALLRAFRSTEWGAYLMGDIVDGHILVKRLYVPPQEVTMTSVDIDPLGQNGKLAWHRRAERETGLKVVGFIHSHNDMNAYFSSVDDDYININYPCSIVVNNWEQYAAKARVFLECGKVSLIETEIEDCLLDIDSAFVETAKARIRKRDVGVAVMGHGDHANAPEITEAPAEPSSELWQVYHRSLDEDEEAADDAMWYE